MRRATKVWVHPQELLPGLDLGRHRQIRLIEETEARFGPGALIWTPMRSSDRMLDDSTLYKTLFEPAALRAGWTYQDVPQWTVKKSDSGELIAVPRLHSEGPNEGKQKTKRAWQWTWRHLRHMYGTYGITPIHQSGFGMSIKEVSVCMGHKNIETTLNHYVGTRRDIGGRLAEATRGRDPRTPDRHLKSA